MECVRLKVASIQEKKCTVQLKKFVISFSNPTKIHYLDCSHGKWTKFPSSKCGFRVWIQKFEYSKWNVFIKFGRCREQGKIHRKQSEIRPKRFLLQFFFPFSISIFMKFIASFCWPLREHIERAEKSRRRSWGGCSAQNHHYKVEYNNRMSERVREENPFIWKSVEIIFIDIVIFFCFLIAFFSLVFLFRVCVH